MTVQESILKDYTEEKLKGKNIAIKTMKSKEFQTIINSSIIARTLKISYKNLKNFIRDGKGVYTPSQAMTIAACIYHLVRDVFLKLGTDIYFSGQVFPQMRVNEERLKQDIIENLDLTPEQIEKVKKISYFKNSLIELSRLDSMY